MITKEEFKEYVKLQMSGRVNMIDVKSVSILTGLTKEQCFEIMEKYSELAKQFEVV